MSEDQGRSEQFLLDMALSREPRAFRDRHNLWRDDLARIYRLLERQVRALPKKGGKNSDEIPHLAIAIFGPAGSGKSSLLRTLAHDVQAPSGSLLRKALAKSDTVEPKNITSLPVMDPTTWRASDQFLYSFLASALETEREAQEQQEHRAPQGLSSVQLAFQEVNEYLRVLDEPEESKEYDPLGLSLQKLERHTSGLRLREALRDFIDRLREAMGAKVVLLPVDDLDMAPAHLVDSLRTYQSYLNHPQLVPVFTFTDRLAEELIEVDFRNQLKEGAYAPPTSSEILPISAKMSVQFLARCFPVRNRIRLGPAPARVQRAALTNVQDSSAGGLEPEVLELLITSSFLLFGHPDKDDSHQVKAALRPSTLRRQFQVVDAMADSRVLSLRTPQFGWMAGLEKMDEIRALAKGPSNKAREDDKLDASSLLGDCPERPSFVELAALEKLSPVGLKQATADPDRAFWVGLQILAQRLYDRRINATWATLFNGSVWSLLNVHRDILRELGLFLEDLYSWTPRELRSVVVEKILAQDRVTRRTVVDRWFNRTDYRRSQILSLLAANIFRPWMPGEEPYGDREGPIIARRSLEKSGEKDLDECWPQDKDADAAQVCERLTLPAVKGLLWFLNVTMGFYLPQIMARDWADAVSPDEPVRGRMSGNGWDLSHAAINAVRMMDVKREIFSFGMHFLDSTGYRRALDAVTYEPKSDQEELWGSIDSRKESSSAAASSEGASWDGHLLLRVWSCSGYSRGRYWAAFSLWRGLGFIGQVLELGLRKKTVLDDLAKRRQGEGEANELAEKRHGEKDFNEVRLEKEIIRLIRSHCLNGLAAGAMLSQNTDEEKLLHGFPRWSPEGKELRIAIELLAKRLVGWLVAHHQKVIYLLPAGPVKVGWSECFIRRVHGDAILGDLWLRLNATYLERQHKREGWHELAARRSRPDLDAARKLLDEQRKQDEQPDQPPLDDEERFRWRASVAAGAWSGILLEYWRGCPPVLELLLSCPAYLKSQEYFGSSGKDEVLKALATEEGEEKNEIVGGFEAAGLRRGLRYERLKRLELPSSAWHALQRGWKNDGEIPGLIPEEFCIQRADPKEFKGAPHQLAVALEPCEPEAIRKNGDEGDRPKGARKPKRRA